MVDITLENAVGGGNLGYELNLNILYKDINAETVRYDPEHWPGLYVQFRELSLTLMVFRTGKYNIAGADSVESLILGKEKFLDIISSFGLSTADNTFEIRNLVYMADYDRELELNAVAVGMGLENAEYEPEQFPGVIFRPPSEVGTFLIFRSGKVILTGIDQPGSQQEAFDQLFQRLDDLFKRSN